VSLRAWILFLALAFLPPAFGFADEPKALTLRVTATAHGPNVLLKDVIVEDLPELLGSLAVKPVGKPGATVSVPKPLVALKLRANDKTEWVLQGPAAVDVTAPAQHVPGLDLQHFAGDFLAAQLSATAGVTLEPQGIPADMEAYEAPIRLQINPTGQDWRGNVILRVQVMQAGAGGQDHEVASVPVSYMVHRRDPRVYSTRAIRKGDDLDGGVLAVKEVDTTFVQGQGFGSVEELAGKRARAYIAPNKVVTADLVELPPLIRRGDVVRVLVKSGAIVVETQGRALRDARLGETLPLELDDTHKQIQARCVEAGVAVKDAF
jgi:flagella basal body P-ring formation protein FlgA